MKRINDPSEIPAVQHFAVLIYKTHSYYVPGDERSRTNPGHGYPGGTGHIKLVEHWVTTDDRELAKFVYEQKKLGKIDVRLDVSVGE